THATTVSFSQGNNHNILFSFPTRRSSDLFSAPVFTDNCGTPTVDSTDSHSGSTCAQSDTRTWRATDGCGNTTSVSQTISYSVDTQAPTVSVAQGNNANIGCNPIASAIALAFSAPVFTDNCGTPTVDSSDSHSGAACAQSDTRTWRATDGCGNTTSVSQTISYSVDTQAPTVSLAQGNNAN